MATLQHRMLEALGLGPDEERLYQALLNEPDSSAAALARAAGISRKVATEPLALLEKKGLIARSSASPVRFSATPPDLALGSLVVAREQELEQARLAIPQLAEQFRASVDQSGLAQLVEVVPGRDAVSRRFEIMQTTSKQEVVSLAKPPITKGIGPNKAELDALARGVRYRAIYDTTSLEIPGIIEHLEVHVRAGEEARISEGLPIKLAIADQKVGLVPIDTGTTAVHGALFLHESSLLSALYDLFERLWHSSRPLQVPGLETADTSIDEELESMDARILLLLRGGMKDQTIATQLDLAISTVERRVRKLMDRLGARSRFQAGAEATRRGWIE